MLTFIVSSDLLRILIEVDVVRHDFISPNMFLTYEKRHKWHYLLKQRVDEVLIFKQFDTKPDIKARCKSDSL